MSPVREGPVMKLMNEGNAFPYFFFTNSKAAVRSGTLCEDRKSVG